MLLVTAISIQEIVNAYLDIMGNTVHRNVHQTARSQSMEYVIEVEGIVHMGATMDILAHIVLMCVHHSAMKILACRQMVCVQKDAWMDGTEIPVVS